MKQVVLLSIFAAVALCLAGHPIAYRNQVPNGWTLGELAHPKDTIEFTILLKQKNLDLLDSTFERVSNPKSSQWGQFMKPSEIDDVVRPDEEAFVAVKNWIADVAPHSTITVKADYIRVKTFIYSASKLFSVPFHFYTHNTLRNKVVIRANGIATIPESVKEHIDFITGISEFFVQDVSKIVANNVAAFDLTVASDAENTLGNDLVITPSLLKSYYKVPDNMVAKNSSNLQGIAAFSDYFSLGALQAFETSQRIPAAQVKRFGPDCFPDCDQYESDLDVQYITSMAQGAHTVFLNQPGNYWILQFAQDAISMTPMPLVFSLSYGWSELQQCDVAVYVCSTLGYSSVQYVTRTNDELKKLAIAGVSVLVSDGDDGAPSLGGAPGNCPIDTKHYCPNGGCAHTASNCSSLTAVNVANGTVCNFPMGLGGDGCAAILNDNNFQTALTEYYTINGASCGFSIELDSEQMPHLYSQCTCDKMTPVSSSGYQIGQFVLNKTLPVFVADYPTSSPYVTSVGATQFIASASGKIEKEVTCSILTGAIITTGGGFSSFQPMPDYQKTAVDSYLKKYSSTLPPSFSYDRNMRAYPDISFNGHHYLIYYSNVSSDACPCLNTEVDGTSCSAPALSGLITLLNDQLLNAGKSPLGFLNYLLYKMAIEQPDAFNDITEGNNNCNRAYCCEYGFQATPGWDATSGLGSPNFANMLRFVLKQKGVTSD